MTLRQDYTCLVQHEILRDRHVGAVLTTSVVGKGIDLHARRGIITRFNVQTSHERSAFAQLSTVANQMGSIAIVPTSILLLLKPQ